MLLENWPFKLAALALALLLWFSVTVEERQDQAVKTDLVVQVQDSDYVLLDAPEEVSTTFQARKGDLLSLLSMRPPTIRYVVDSVRAPQMQIELTPAMVQYNHDVNARPVDVRPSAVELRFERRAQRRVPVRISKDTNISPASGFAVVGSPAVQPESVTIRGASSAVSGVDAVETEAADLEDVGQTLTRELQLVNPRGHGPLQIEPRHVLVTVEVDSIVQRRFRVPVTVEGSAASSVRLDPDSVQVLVGGAHAVVRQISRRDLTATISLESLPAEGTTEPVRLRAPSGLSVTLKADPASVRVVPTDAPARKGP